MNPRWRSGAAVALLLLALGARVRGQSFGFPWWRDAQFQRDLSLTPELMLLHMRQVLSPEQRVKLNKLHDQWEKDHRRERGK